MRGKGKRKLNIAAGFYQEPSTAHAVISKLKKHRFLRVASLRYKHDGKLEINRCISYFTLCMPLIGLLLGTILLLSNVFFSMHWSPSALVCCASVVAALSTSYFFWWFRKAIDPEVIHSFTKLVMADEILILVQIKQQDVREVLNILRQVKSGHPVTFLLREELLEERDVEIFSEPMKPEQMAEEALRLASVFQKTSREEGDNQLLMKRFQKCNQLLHFLRRDIADAEYIEQTLPSAAEWLLDNMYILEGSIESVKLNLPKKYYKVLPKIVEGPLKGLPRVYGLASEFVKNSAGRLNRDNISTFLENYQKVHPLTIGELWAFPLMLRFRLIECIEFLAIHVDNRMREGELAGFWGNRLLSAARHDQSKVPSILLMLSSEEGSLSAHFAEELLDHLFDEESILPLIKEWVEKRFSQPLADLFHQEHRDETSEQVLFSNSIKSLITLSQLAWRDIFESVSAVDALLKDDPAGVYLKMDFTTRNSYRDTIEQIARRLRIEEVEVAEKTVLLSQKGVKEFEKHVGYFLVDAGRSLLEKEMGYRPYILQTVRRAIISHACFVYLGGILFFLLLAENAAFWLMLKAGIGVSEALLFISLSLLPISELSVQGINFLLSSILPPLLRPKMSYQNGIPKEYKTLIVVPMMLGTLDSIQAAIDQLEIRYLANTDPLLRFALFSDYSDANAQNDVGDAALLAAAVSGLEGLERKYGTHKFFLFHRKRAWSSSENRWIGWERKRGKLETLNRYLTGEALSENIVHMGHAEALKGVRFVITLDADTQLPKDQARAMIEVISHPLNRPWLNEAKNRVVRGFGIIQPRVGTDFVDARTSWFSKIFSEPTVVDPYTQAISNVYQDLVGEGSYHGKGIYDLEVFHTILSGRFPEEHLLSHDLIEGAYVRVGFASSICLFDQYPKDYLIWAKRQQRWMRGDWQIVDWLLPKVPVGSFKGTKKTEKNPLFWLNRWKIFDNLRRALLPVSLMLLLTGAWIFSVMPEVWTAVGLIVLLLPCLSLCAMKLFSSSFASLISTLNELKILLLRSVVTIALLPYEAFLALDALTRVIFRRMVSRRNLLQWSASELRNNEMKVHQKFLLQLGLVSFFSVGILGAVVALDPYAELIALPFCMLWLAAPLIVQLLDKPLSTGEAEKLSEADQKMLKEIAFKTWTYFDHFVGPQTHWMPPDNYQAALNVEIAQRTSPTNIGLWLLAVMGAYDFDFINCDLFTDKITSTFKELKKLERHEGHFLNWYNIQTLDPLFPRYVSTVDSGNFLACIWTLNQGLIEMLSAPLSPVKTARYFAWLELLSSLSLDQLLAIDSQAGSWREEALAWTPSLEELATTGHAPALDQLIERAQRSDLSQEIRDWSKALQEALATARWFAGEKIGQAQEIMQEIEQYTREMNLKFLYNSDRKLFAIGYNVDDHKLDSSFYDLLASEARIASLVAIAKEDVPLEHWWALGRVYNKVQGRRVLLSWGGTMFEYLMPLLFNKQYPDSLLGDACDAAVVCQIAYGKKRGIPWGISESAFSAIDSHKIYQYKSFGIPGLGLKRGLEEDLVISPYSSALALAVKPRAALENLRRLADKNHTNMLGEYGYFESIDFTRQRSPKGERGVVVYAYMAHHQGMVLSAINNVMHHDVLINRFHKDPRISGVSSLVHERIPLSTPVKISNMRKEPALRRLEPFSQTPLLGVVKTPESVTPKVNLLSNGKYSLMISNSGGGYSRWGEIEIYRWRSDTTRDAWGCFCYIKDMSSGEVWSAAYQPTQTQSQEYHVNFKSDKAEFIRKKNQIETLMELVVSPEDDIEIRLITLINHSNETRYLELTSYLELVIAPHLADRAHPAFNKLFIETEALPELSALLGFRRLRSPEEAPLWAMHLVSASEKIEELQYETDRARFIGRGRSLKHPLALEGDLSNTTGTVLDPIFSLRKRVRIAPGKRVQFSFATGIAADRASAIAMAEKYQEISASHHAIELAWTYAQLELRYLRIHQEEVQLFQKLASRLIYPHAQLRTVEERIRKNRLGQSGLWPQGISGDLPIVVVTVGDVYDVDLVKQLLIAHAFWNLRGLKADLVILNEEEKGYMQPLQEQLQRLVQAHSFRNLIDVPGGVFLKNSALIPLDQLNLILSVARAVLVASRGSLRQQLVSPKVRGAYSPKSLIKEKTPEVPSMPLPFLELPYFNGLGGYTSDGRSYVIYLGPNTSTPAPWINVLANPQFGTLVSEAGLGSTWYGNSQTNRLTPWSNDPVLDPITDTIYIRDEELGTVWTTTPAPIRELDAYRISHSQGHSRFEHISHAIEQELLIFVPVDDQGGLPLRIQRLSLTNHSSRRRRLNITAYSDWVLGSDREETQMHVVTEWDSESQALFAYNRTHPDFGSHVAFTSCSHPVTSFTADRTEFIGRNRSTSSPEAMGRKFLSRATGAALDPCSALQIMVEIDPKQKCEWVFIMGYAADVPTARRLITDARVPGKIDQLLSETHSWWDKTLETIQVDVPDKATNFLMNRWLIYQDLSCRFWGRAGFYQSSGAYGFRDQLQDTLALLYFVPQLARDYILKAAARQFLEGDVQHWWHPQSGAGVRTRCSDDLLWLPFVTAQYVRVTGDLSILNEKVSFLESDKLADGQEELLQVPKISQESASLLEHCRRAIKKGSTSGPHGLPLIGSCDWNDGMNRVGIKEKGESVWLGWFLIHVMNDFADLLTLASGSKETGEGFRNESKHLAQVIESTAWDGAWYRRAYFDDGTPIGSKENEEATIDSLTQSWAVLSGLANPERSALALKSAEEYLVKEKDNLVLLLTPPFDKTTHDPGYIKGYPPGVRENGGQYTHAAAWLAMAYARRGEGDKAVQLLRMISPTPHTGTPEANQLYKVEPYIIAADIYDLKHQVGRGGWTWYTGSAAWIYRTWLEEVIGFKLKGQTLTFNCAIPKEWGEFKLFYRYQSSHYAITVKNPDHMSRGALVMTLDGMQLSTQEIPLVDDGASHIVEILMTKNI